MTKENKEPEVNITKPDLCKPEELDHAQLMQLLSDWRKKIKIGELDKNAVSLEAYLVLVSDELFRRINGLMEAINILHDRLPAKEEN